MAFGGWHAEFGLLANLHPDLLPNKRVTFATAFLSGTRRVMVIKS